MLPNHAPLYGKPSASKTLERFFLGRIDHGLGRAPAPIRRHPMRYAAVKASPTRRFLERLPGMMLLETRGFPPATFSQCEAMPIACPAADLSARSSDYSAQLAGQIGAASPSRITRNVSRRRGDALYRDTFKPSVSHDKTAGDSRHAVVCADTDEEPTRLAQTFDLNAVRRQRRITTAGVTGVCAAYDYTRSDRARIAQALTHLGRLGESGQRRVSRRKHEGSLNVS